MDFGEKLGVYGLPGYDPGRIESRLPSVDKSSARPNDAKAVRQGLGDETVDSFGRDLSGMGYCCVAGDARPTDDAPRRSCPDERRG